MDKAKGGNPRQKLLIMGGGILVIVLSLSMLGSPFKKAPFDSATAQLEAAMKKGDYAGAVKKAQARLEIAQKTFEPNSPQVTDSMHDIGAALAADGKFDQAKEWVVKSINMEMSARGEKGTALPEKLVTLAEVQEGLGNHSVAEGYGKKAIEFFEAIPAEKKIPERARALAITAIAALAQNHCDEALKTAEDGLRFSNVIGKDVNLMQSLTASAGRAEFCLRHPEKAESYIKDAMLYAKKQKVGTDPELPKLTALQGEILCAMDKCKQGLKLQNEAYKMAKKVFGEDDPQTLALQPKDFDEPTAKSSKHKGRDESRFDLGSESGASESSADGKHFESF